MIVLSGGLSGRQYLADLLLRLRLSAHALKKVTDNTDATDFIFHRFNNIMRYHLILDLLRIAFAPIRRGITASKR